MTTEEAIAKLKESGVRFHAFCGLIRASGGQCPVIMLAESIKARTYDNCQWAEAADDIGLPYADALSIVAAADGHNPKGSLHNELLSLCQRSDGQ